MYKYKLLKSMQYNANKNVFFLDFIVANLRISLSRLLFFINSKLNVYFIDDSRIFSWSKDDLKLFFIRFKIEN